MVWDDNAKKQFKPATHYHICKKALNRSTRSLEIVVVLLEFSVVLLANNAT